MAEFTITATCTVTDAAERQRRLSQVYGLLLDLARRKREPVKVSGSDMSSPHDNGNSLTRGAGE